MNIRRFFSLFTFIGVFTLSLFCYGQNLNSPFSTNLPTVALDVPAVPELQTDRPFDSAKTETLTINGKPVSVVAITQTQQVIQKSLKPQSFSFGSAVWKDDIENASITFYYTTSTPHDLIKIEAPAERDGSISGNQDAIGTTVFNFVKPTNSKNQLVTIKTQDKNAKTLYTWGKQDSTSYNFTRVTSEVRTKQRSATNQFEDVLLLGKGVVKVRHAPNPLNGVFISPDGLPGVGNPYVDGPVVPTPLSEDVYNHLSNFLIPSSNALEIKQSGLPKQQKNKDIKTITK